jgi:anaphase-promoting complex subunit 1
MSIGGASIDDTLEDIEEDSFATVEDFDELDDMFSAYPREGDQEPMNGLRKEILMKKVTEIPVHQYLKFSGAPRGSNASHQSSSRVFVVAAPFNSGVLHERRIYIYIVHSGLRNPLECELSIGRKRLLTSSSTPKATKDQSKSRHACVATFVKTQEMKDTQDVLKIVDGQVERILSLHSAEPREPFLSLTAGWGVHLPNKFTIGPLKLFDPYAILTDTSMRKTAGLKRNINAHKPLRGLLSPGMAGSFDLVDGESRRHRLQLCLTPHDSFISEIFDGLSLILPNHVGDFLREIWWSIRRSLAKELDQTCSPEWTALLTTLFSMAVPFVEDSPNGGSNPAKTVHKRSGSRPSQLDSDEDDVSAWRLMCDREIPRSNARIWDSGPWSWILAEKPSAFAMSPPPRRSSHRDPPTMSEHLKSKKNTVTRSIKLARQFMQSPIGIATNDQWRRMSAAENQDLRTSYLPQVLVLLHLMREEFKLNILSDDHASPNLSNLTPLLAQLGHWLRWESWDWKRGTYYELDGGSSDEWSYEDSYMTPTGFSQPWESPPSMLKWLGTTLRSQSYSSFPTLTLFIREPTSSPRSPFNIEDMIATITPRTIALIRYFHHIHEAQSSPRKAVELILRSGISPEMLATLPETARAPFMEAIVQCQTNPPTTWSSSLLRLVQREDLDLSMDPRNDSLQDVQHSQWNSMMGLQSSLYQGIATRDIHTICAHADRTESIQSTTEVERHYITRLIFQEDRRYMEVHSLLEPLKQTVAEYRPAPGVEESEILDAEKNLMQWVMLRTFSLPIGNSMVRFSSKKPLLTERFNLYGFATSCLMKPTGHIVTAERSNYSEEKFFWAFFNAGVGAGLSIARDAQGIDTSWIMYNKPAELTNKHAGLLLGLGLNGHLKTIAKWLSFKYLTPKHTMTSVGLLLGLSASYMGTMDTLVTRLLSVHVTRMLPPGAAELNLSPYTQTTGLMGIGLLYYNTQHRRMSEIMLSEIEYVDRPDPSEPPDTLRDEAYRLAAGFALGFINLGKGKDLRGLHDMRIVERLMGVAVAPKPVDVVHILDQATAGAVIAIALIFMKTHDETVARKIDIPDTLPQFDYVRPDIFLLRTLAKHLIMWDNITANKQWVKENLPVEYQNDYDLKRIHKLRSEQMPFFNIIAGLLWSVSLKYAGTGDTQVRDFLIKYLDEFMRICKLPALRYDSRLTRNTVRNCQDLIALSAATVMAGTGDLEVFRRLRGLHGRVGSDYPYGSHLAAHMAFGALFIGGGTYTFSTSDKAIAALICAFYPLYPMEVQDSKAHLQAFRHFWVLAAEPRCIVVRDVDTGRATSVALKVCFRDDTERKFVAPCLLPELHTISTITTTNIEYWPATLDFVNNPLHLETFKANQTLHVRRRSAHHMYSSTFSAGLIALNDAQSSRTARAMWDWLFSLPALREFEKADIGLVLPVDPYSGTFLDTTGTVVDERLVLRGMTRSWRGRDLWDLGGLFEWDEVAFQQDGRLRWLGREVLERLKAAVLERGRAIEAA